MGATPPVAEMDGTGNLVSQFVYGPRSNVPSLVIKNGVTYRIIADHVRSVRLVVRTTDGVVMQRLDYDEFGRILGNSSPGFQPFRFAGGLVDDHTGFVHFGLRDYDPTIGRWTAKDAAQFRAGRVNLYAYARLDPVNRLDPVGYTDFGNGKPEDLVNGLRNALPTIDEVVREVLPAYDEAVIVSTTSGAHNEGSLHSVGQAIDIRIYSDPNVIPPDFIENNPEGWISPEDSERLTQELQKRLGDNFRVRNERTRPPGQEVWGGPHIHIEVLCPRGSPTSRPGPSR